MTNRHSWKGLRTMPALILPALLACTTSTAPNETVIEASFEQGLGAWTAHATDIMVGGEQVEWSIVASPDRATAGSNSVRMTVDNRSDAAKLWIERSVQLEPNSTYAVTISFDFATADFGDVNLWTIIAGAFSSPPRSGQALQQAARGETGKPGTGSDFVWLEKSYDTTVATGADGMALVVVGIWGTFEVTRTYFFDDVRVTFRLQS